MSAINDAGEIVGSYCTLPSCDFHGFIYAKGKFTSYDGPGASNTYFTGLNGAGTIIGTVNTVSLISDNAFTLTASGTFTTILSGGDAGTVTAGGINDSGQVAGDNNYLSYSYANGVASPGPFPADSLTTTVGISARGQVAGTYVPPGSVSDEGFVYVGSKLTSINGPGAANTYIYGTNDAGVVVGAYNGSGGLIGFAYSKGIFTTIAPPKDKTTAARAISASGVIGGVFATRDSQNAHLKGFVAVPSD